MGVGNNLGFKKLSSSAPLEATASLKRTAEWSKNPTGAITLTLDIHMNCKRSRVLVPLVGEDTLWSKSSWWQKSINLVVRLSQAEIVHLYASALAKRGRLKYPSKRNLEWTSFGTLSYTNLIKESRD